MPKLTELYIAMPNRIRAGVGIRVNATVQSDQIGLRVPDDGRVVVSESVLMQSRLSNEDLSCEDLSWQYSIEPVS